MSDEEIYEGVAKGDRSALEAFYSETKEHVQRVVSFFLGEDESMPAVVVGVYGRGLSILGAGKIPSKPLKDWLSALAAQECFAVLAKLRADYDQQTKTLEDMAGKIPTLVEITNDAKERVNFMIRGDIEDIPDIHRQILAMSELEGLHFLELAKRLSCSWSTVLNRLMAARNSLAKRVKENFGL